MSWLVLNTLTAAALALIVLAAGRWLKPAPAVMHVLWLFVLLKLVTPPLFTIPVDVAWLQPPRAAAPVERAEPVAPTAPAATAPVLADAATPAGATFADPIVRALRAARAPEPWTWTELVLSAWATGSLAMLVWFAAGLLRGRRHLRTLGAVPPQLAREVEALAAQLRVRVPRLRDDAGATSPYVWSFGAVRLVLPVRTLLQATGKGRAAVIVHELAHLRRLDHLLAHAELLLAVVLWWHPLFWFARNRLRLWAELACDAWAVACVPDSTIDYATVLVNAVSSPDFTVRAPAVLAARPAARAAFEKRLTMILNENVPCRASRGWWLPFATLAVGLFTVPVAAQRTEQDPVRVEIRVNGKEVDELSAAERKALLQRLLREEERAGEIGEGVDGKAGAARKDPIERRSKAAKPDKTDKPAKAGKPDDAGKPAKSGKPGKVTRRVKTYGGDPIVIDTDEQSAGKWQDILAKALDEARVEIMDDDDLRALGITDDVVRLLDDIADGKGLENSIDGLVKSALLGARKVAVEELRSDADLEKLGLTKDIESLLQQLLDSDHTAIVLKDLTTHAIDDAMNDVKRDLRDNPDLKHLGIDLETLLEQVMRGTHGDEPAKDPKVERRRAVEPDEAKEPEAVEERPAPKKARDRSLIR